MSTGWRALLVVAGSALLGASYFLYLRAEPFPPDMARLIPVTWLAGTLYGGVLAARGLARDRQRVAAIATLALAVPSALLAIVFTLAALLGD